VVRREDDGRHTTIYCLLREWLAGPLFDLTFSSDAGPRQPGIPQFTQTDIRAIVSFEKK